MTLQPAKPRQIVRVGWNVDDARSYLMLNKSATVPSGHSATSAPSSQVDSAAALLGKFLAETRGELSELSARCAGDQSAVSLPAVQQESSSLQSSVLASLDEISSKVKESNSLQKSVLASLDGMHDDRSSPRGSPTEG